jgi:hypothetical protein
MEAPEVAVAIVTDTDPVKLPSLGVIVGVATVDAVATLRVKAVVLVTPPPVEETVTGKLPAGVEPLVAMVSFDEQVGLQEAEEKEAIAPEGNPDTVKETAWALPDDKAALMEFVTEDPPLSDLSPELVRVKLKLLLVLSAFANHTLASELSFMPFLNAFAFTSVLLDRANEPAYLLDDWVGDWPSVV